MDLSRYWFSAQAVLRERAIGLEEGGSIDKTRCTTNSKNDGCPQANHRPSQVYNKNPSAIVTLECPLDNWSQVRATGSLMWLRKAA